MCCFCRFLIGKTPVFCLRIWGTFCMVTRYKINDLLKACPLGKHYSHFQKFVLKSSCPILYLNFQCLWRNVVFGHCYLWYLRLLQTPLEDSVTHIGGRDFASDFWPRTFWTLLGDTINGIKQNLTRIFEFQRKWSCLTNQEKQWWDMPYKKAVFKKDHRNPYTYLLTYYLWQCC